VNLRPEQHTPVNLNDFHALRLQRRGRGGPARQAGGEGQGPVGTVGRQLPPTTKPRARVYDFYQANFGRELESTATACRCGPTVRAMRPSAGARFAGTPFWERVPRWCSVPTTAGGPTDVVGARADPRSDQPHVPEPVSTSASSGAINEALSDIMGELIGPRFPWQRRTTGQWLLGEGPADRPPIRSMKSAQHLSGDPRARWATAELELLGQQLVRLPTGVAHPQRCGEQDGLSARRRRARLGGDNGGRHRPATSRLQILVPAGASPCRPGAEMADVARAAAGRPARSIIGLARHHRPPTASRPGQGPPSATDLDPGPARLHRQPRVPVGPGMPTKVFFRGGLRARGFSRWSAGPGGGGTDAAGRHPSIPVTLGPTRARNSLYIYLPAGKAPAI